MMSTRHRARTAGVWNAVRFRLLRIQRVVARTAVVVVSLTFAPGAQRQRNVVWKPAVERLPSPAGPNSAQPQLSVSNRGILLSWIERDGSRATLKYSERTRDGWSPARVVVSGTNWFVNWADVPSVVRLDDGTLVAHWLQKSGADPYAYDVRLSYSKDNGKTWMPSFTPHSDGTQTEHGFVSLFQMPRGGLGLVWLDGRAMKPGSGHGPHAESGAMGLWFGAFDGTWKQTTEIPVDLRVCECCPTTAVITADGPIAAFRNRTEDEVRDIHVARFEHNKWIESKAVFDDGWKIAACPVNGPMLSARNRDVAIAWFTLKADVGRAFVSFSNDAGRTFGAPIRVDDNGTLGRVDVELLPDRSALASWIELGGSRAQFTVRRVDSNGARSAALTVSELANNRASGYPRIASHNGEVVFAWTGSLNNLSQVQTAAAPISANAAR